MIDQLPIILTGLLLFLTGLACLIFPKSIQSYTIRSNESAKGIAKFNPFIHWIKTPTYLITLRTIGALSLIASGLCGYFLTL
jgi:hypothetical protein